MPALAMVHPDFDDTWRGLRDRIDRLADVPVDDRMEMLKRLTKDAAAFEVHIREAWRLSFDLLAIVGMDRRFIVTSPSWFRELGWGRFDLQGRDFADIVHPDDLVRILDTFSSLAVGSRAERVLSRVMAADGRTVWVSSNAVRFENGNVFSTSRTMDDADPRIAAALNV